MFGSLMVLVWEQVCDVLCHGTVRNCSCGELFGDVMGGRRFDLIYAFNDEKTVDLFSRWLVRFNTFFFFCWGWDRSFSSL